MQSLLNVPEKVKEAIYGPSPDRELFIVIDMRSGRPQYFCPSSEDEVEKVGFGCFMDAAFEPDEEAPAGVYDRETALYLIAQTAINYATHEQWHQNDYTEQPVFRLMPVY